MRIHRVTEKASTLERFDGYANYLSMLRVQFWTSGFHESSGDWWMEWDDDAPLSAHSIQLRIDEPIPELLAATFGRELCEDIRCELATDHAPYWHGRTENGLVVSTWRDFNYHGGV